MSFSATYELPTDKEYKRDPFVPEFLPTVVYVMREGTWYRVDDTAGGEFVGMYLVSPTVILGYWRQWTELKPYYAIKVIE